MWKKKGREGAGNGNAATYTGPDAKRKGGQADGVDQIRWQDSGFQEVSSPPPYRKSSRRQRAPRGSRLDASTGTLVYSHTVRLLWPVTVTARRRRTRGRRVGTVAGKQRFWNLMGRDRCLLVGERECCPCMRAPGISYLTEEDRSTTLTYCRHVQLRRAGKKAMVGRSHLLRRSASNGS